MLIAAVILSCESQDRLFDNNDHWYPQLLNKVDSPFESLDFSKLAIITFNYDCSLEQFLFLALTNRHNKGPADVQHTLESLKIIHAYGHLGPLEWQSEKGRRFNFDQTSEQIGQAAKGIQIIAEGRDDSSALVEARNLVDNAHRVIFLGMAYHVDNMRRLGFPRKKSEWQRICGSMYGLSAKYIDMIRLRNDFDSWGQPGEKCLQFLNNNNEFLQL